MGIREITELLLPGSKTTLAVGLWRGVEVYPLIGRNGTLPAHLDGVATPLRLRFGPQHVDLGA
jgi:hypothetical protein